MSKPKKRNYRPRVKRSPSKDPADQLSVRIGIATVGRGGKIRYIESKLIDLWFADPSQTIIDFAHRYELSYNQVYRILHKTVARKKAVHGALSGGYILSVTRALVQKSADRAEEDAEMVSSAISELAVFARSAGIFARARMAKMSHDGKEIVNVDVKASEVLHYSAIARDVSATIKNLIEVRRPGGATGSDAESIIDELILDAPPADVPPTGGEPADEVPSPETEGPETISPGNNP